MESIRGTVCLMLLVTGSFALPPAPSSSQTHSRGTVRAKQTTPVYPPEGKPTPSMSPGIASKPVSPVSAVTIKPDAATTPASGGTSNVNRRTTAEMQLGNVKGAGVSASTASGLPTASRSSVTASMTTTTAAPSPSNGGGSSVAPIETSSRTIASAQDAATTFHAAPRKPTTGATEFSTTVASVSAKETRESPGKIRPQIKLTTNYTSVGETGVRLPEGASAALAKPTKYHYYPHNQHIYLLPECAVQQVCNAVYVRLNFTQPLCACPGRYRDPCSASLDSDDLHTTELVTDPRTKALTLVKTCEPVAEMRECRTPRDWSLLALQNVRTGKSHYLVICRCPDANILEGPMSHDQPTYASVPGIRVYGMMCVQGNRRGRPLRHLRSVQGHSEARSSEDTSYKEEEDNGPRFPWHKVQQLMDAAVWD